MTSIGSAPEGTLEIAVEPDGMDAGEPRAFLLAGHWIEIARVLDRWPGSDHLYLKVQNPEGDLFLLRRDDPTGRWSLHSFRAGPTPG